jgi:hypothetical protein
MRKRIVFALFLISTAAVSQEHFAGLNTSSRVGILTAGMNPAELVLTSPTIKLGSVI